MEPKDLYKLMRIPSLAEALAKRSKYIVAERQEKRRECFWGSRVDLNKSPVVEKKKPSRAEMLKKWKAEKMKKLEEEKKKQKPVFKVGIVHRKATGSPDITAPRSFKNATAVHQAVKKPEKNEPPPGRTQVLTRAKAKNLGIKVKAVEMKTVVKPQNKGFNNVFYKIEAGKKKQIDTHVFRVPETVSKLPCQGLTYPNSPKLLKRKERHTNLRGKKVDVKAPPVTNTPEEESTEKEMGECMGQNECSEEKIVEEPVVDNKTEEKEEKSSGGVEKESIPNDAQPKMVTPPRNEVEPDDYRPIVYSPFVTVRSGRKSKRKSKKSLNMDVEEQIKKEESEFQCRIFSFRKYIDCERKRLLETCDKWKRIYEEFEEVPPEVEGDIDSVVGKTNLLVSDKFMQFKGLIDKCENGDPFVKVDDLQGFQDWVSIEVERIDGEFHKLEKLKTNNWKVETVAAAANVTKLQKVKGTKNLPKKPVGSSNIRSHILAARKLLKEGNLNGVKDGQQPSVPFEAVVKVATPKKKASLLKDVLNSETKKKNESSSAKKSPIVRERRNSGLEIMIATQKNKYPTPVKLQRSPLLTDYEIYIGKEETPSRSILKKTPKVMSSSKGHVSFREHTENGPRGLSEKYFQPSADDDFSPARTILGDLGNITPSGMMTRSRKRQISSAFSSPQVL